ncbi:hypothetical protein BY996DRAFT_4584132 [Phakopsora pachyrhizi]|uniref:Piwi domain-containing protein n=1 Tax=Phakopsora pachyrhizi TaxID=170000 RepID=A0AAV0BKT5_PHAPC|nr:hypothetical protein BY996DRAFT_4589429 [Phakopsora pachyrhizi]KAI8452711.1 hypothetical protein BY996DRAFT_4584129 [Phakopsora pachyrhizi]KAI8452712.1 hypothetical protein BY996DRAFT_4584132 [Phakopsora pachyrhizi]CAH7686724.1 hypothetical protein PPACK8108_LOCUS21420 [Phakopsora pachyrhizi]
MIHRIRFERDPDDADRSNNFQPGTIIDKVIRDPFIYNLLFQSQASFNSTSYPTRYIVQKDETNHTVDDPQNIANSVCSASQRANKSVGIATPT